MLRRAARSLSVGLVLLSTLPACARIGSGSGRAERVILITCDTLRSDRLGAYGYPRDVSPNLDAFAREALVFDTAYSTAPLTGPSLAALFTGRYPDELGVSANNQTLLPPEATTLTEVLQDAGVPTAAIVSNWVLRRREGSEEAGLHQGFDHYDDVLETAELNREQVFERVADATTEAAVTWLRNRPSDRFFLWVHYQDPHGPYTPPDSYVTELDRPLGDERELRAGTTNRGYGDLPAYQTLGDERHPEYYRIRYDAEIRYFDNEVGRLFESLRAHGLYDRALIVFSSDHGESLGEHGWWFSHGHTLYRELVHVPLMIRYPSGASRPSYEIRNGVSRVSRLVDHLDLWPTILEAFGVQAPPSRGASLFREPPAERMAAHNLRAPGMPTRWLGITTEQYRLLVRPEGPLLFDVQNDPYETVNLARSDVDRVESLLETYKAMLAELPELGLEGTKAKVDEDAQRALEKLGYGGGE